MSLSKLSQILKHLPGQHDQKTHGRRGRIMSHKEMKAISFDWDELSMADDEFNIAVAYCAASYEDINNWLRGKEHPYGLNYDNVSYLNSLGQIEKIPTEKAVDIMDSLVDMQPPLPHSITVFRGIGHTIGDQAEPGFRFKDEGFSSTSIEEYQAMDFGDGVIAEINVPEGMKGIYVADPRITSYDDEFEYILPRGLTYEVTAIKNGKIYMDVVEE